MTLKEFEAWFEGLHRNLNGLPNQEEIASGRICSKIKSIDGEHRPETVFIDRYWAHPGRPWDYPGSLVFFGRRKSTKRSAH